MKLNLGIAAGILLLVPLSAWVAGQAPRPNSGGSELEKKGNSERAGGRGQEMRAGARDEGGGKPRPYGSNCPFTSKPEPRRQLRHGTALS